MTTNKRDLPKTLLNRPLFARGTETALRTGLDQLVRRNLRGVWVRGDLPAAGAVWASNHHSWWDFFVAVAAFRSTGRVDVGVLMSPDNIGHRDLFRAIGAVGVDELRSAVEMVAGGMVMIVFPEGELRPSGPLGTTRPGAAWLAERAGVPLLPVATRVLLRGQQAAEAYLDVGVSVAGTDLEPALAERLVHLDGRLATENPEVALDGFTQLVTGVRSWHERFGGRLVRR